MLPGRDGPEILQTLRARGTHTPVLLLTARDALEDRVFGLDSGADDYLVKPFAFPELLARVRALLRRTDERVEPTRRALADLTLDLDTRRVRRGGREIESDRARVRPACVLCSATGAPSLPARCSRAMSGASCNAARR